MRNIKIIFLITAGLILGLLVYFLSQREYTFYLLDKQNRLRFPFSPETYHEIISEDKYSENIYLAKVNENLYLKIIYHPDMEIESNTYNPTAISFENNQPYYFYSYYNLICQKETVDRLVCKRVSDENKSYHVYSAASLSPTDLPLPKQTVEELFKQEFADDKAVHFEDYWIGQLSKNKYIIFLHDKNYCGGSAGCWPGIYLYKNEELVNIGSFGAIDCDYTQKPVLCSRTFADNH